MVEEDRSLGIKSKEVVMLPHRSLKYSVPILAITIDDEYIYSACNDKTVKVWSKTDLTEIASLEHSEWIDSVTVDDKYVITGERKCVRIWNKEDWSEVATVGMRTDLIKAVKLRPVTVDDDYLYSVVQDDTLQIWSKKDWSEVASISEHKDTITTLLTDNEYFYSVSADKTIQVWSKTDWSNQATLHVPYIVSLATDETYLYAGSIDGTIHVLNKRNWSETVRLRGHPEVVSSLAVGEQYIYSGHPNGLIRIWRKNDWSEVVSLRGHAGKVNSIVMDGLHLYSSSSDNTIRIWSKWINSEVTILEGQPFRITHMGFDDNYVYSVSKDTIILWAKDNWSEKIVIKDYSDDTPSSITDNLRYDWIDDKTIRIWNEEDDHEVSTIIISASKLIVTDEKYIYTKNEFSVDVQEKKDQSGSSQIIASLRGHEGLIVCLTTDKKFVYSGARDGTVKVWRKSDWTEVTTLRGHEDYVESIAVDDTYIYTGSFDHSIRVWKKDDWCLARIITGNVGMVSHVAADEKYVYSCGRDNNVKVWRKPGYLPTLYLFTQLPMHLAKENLHWILDNLQQSETYSTYSFVANLQNLEGTFLPIILPYLDETRQKEYLKSIRRTSHEVPLRFASFQKELRYEIPKWSLRLWFSFTNPSELPTQNELTEIPLTQVRSHVEVRLPNRRETAIHFRLELDRVPIEFAAWIESVVLTIESDRGDVTDVRFTDFKWDNERNVIFDWGSFKLDLGYSVRSEATLLVTAFQVNYTKSMAPRVASPSEKAQLLVSSRIEDLSLKLTKSVEDLSRKIEELSRLESDKAIDPIEDRASTIERESEDIQQSSYQESLKQLQDRSEWIGVYDEFQRAFSTPVFPSIIVKLGRWFSGLGRFMDTYEAQLIALSIIPSVTGFAAVWLLPFIVPGFATDLMYPVLITGYIIVAIIGSGLVFSYLLGGWWAKRRKRRRQLEKIAVADMGEVPKLLDEEVEPEITSRASDLNMENYQKFIDSNRFAVILFYSKLDSFTGRFQELTFKVFSELGIPSKELPFVFGRLEIDDASIVQERFDVVTLPCLIFFAKGHVRHKFGGMVEEDELRNALMSLLLDPDLH